MKITKFLIVVCIAALHAAGVSAEKRATSVESVATQGVIKTSLAKGVGLDEAVESMKLQANSLNMKRVSELPLSKQVTP